MCSCGPDQNVSSSVVSFTVSAPSEGGIGGVPCAPIICSTTIFFEGNFINGLPAGTKVKILPCHNLTNTNTVTLLANQKTFNSCQSDAFEFTVTDTNVFTFVFKIQTPILFYAVLQPTPLPTTTPVPTTTVNYYKMKADVVIIIDGSDTVSSSQAMDIKLFLLNSFQNFDIDSDYFNIAIIVALGDQFPVALVKNTFHSVNTLTGLKNALDSAFDNSEFESQTGQDSLASAVKRTYLEDFLNRGYRRYINNHLIIYVTTTNSPNQEAINQARTVMKQNLFNFIAVGYQGGNNQQALSNFVGSPQCAIVSSNGETISNMITDKIVSANFNGGKYC
jgi:hypothetical protein